MDSKGLEKHIDAIYEAQQLEKLKRMAEDMKNEYEEEFAFPDLRDFSTTQLKAELRRRKRKGCVK